MTKHLHLLIVAAMSVMKQGQESTAAASGARDEESMEHGAMREGNALVEKRLPPSRHGATDRATVTFRGLPDVVEVRDDEDDRDDEDVKIRDLSCEDSFDVEVIEEYAVVSSRSLSHIGAELAASKEGNATSQASERSWLFGQQSINFLKPRRKLRNINVVDPRMTPANIHVDTARSSNRINKNSIERENNNHTNKLANEKSTLDNIKEDFSKKGEQKILRAIGWTAIVNGAVLVTAATGGAAGAVGYAIGGAIAAKRLSDGIFRDDEREVTKSLVAYSCATGASVAGKAAARAIIICFTGASLPLASGVAIGVGCCSSIAAGVLSEWKVESVVDRMSLPQICKSSPTMCSEGDSPLKKMSSEI